MQCETRPVLHCVGAADTCYRFDSYIKGKLNFSDSAERQEPSEKLKDSCDMLLYYLNGDIRSAKMTHHEVGCCQSPEETKANLVGAIFSSGLLLGSDVDLPSENKWTSVTRALGKVVGGMLFHQVLARAIQRAFKSADKDIKAMDEEEDYKLFCKKKLFRTLKVMENPCTTLKWALLSFSSEPLDHCWQRLQYLESHGQVLTECSGLSFPCFFASPRCVMLLVLSCICWTTQWQSSPLPALGR